MIENLKKTLRQEDTVIFIGSGVSLWSGLPSWTGLIQELIDFIKESGLDATLTEQELKRGDLLQAASYGFDKLTKPHFAQFIRKVSRLGTATPHDIHNKIVELGPTCYITTNYDKLLELSFQKWKHGTYFRTVINTQLTETAEIVGARANNFLFKLHGDAENSDSIILTREQYRALNTGGELLHAMETTKALMLSRPIVYIGFGLRDPDFLYLKDLLINTYKGGARDHYAIMSDIGEQEKDYWRRNFGIHLIDYQTIPKPNGKRDHSPILKLLDDLKIPETNTTSPTSILNSEFILSLNRHSAKYFSFETSKLHLPLVVHPIEDNKKGKFNFRFYEAAIEELLDKGPDKIILIGLPGGGKSYSLKASIARLSKKLSKDCIDDSIRINETIVPIYVDLKLYEGNLVKLIEQNIPTRINFALLCSTLKVKLYLDAFNEIPKEYIESKTWNSDFSNLLEKYNLSIVISSRTIDGLEDLEFPGFNLDSIEEDFIKTSLSQNQIELKGLFRNEIIALLQKPFFYKLIFENKFEIEAETNPQKIYLSLVNLINKRLNDRFNVNINLLDSLSIVAMEALDNGEEAFKIEILKRHIDLELKKTPNTTITSLDIINWMVSQDFLIPIINERICFFHQSVTEYLAAKRLSELFVENNNILTKKLSFRRWDQALFLCLSLLKKENAEKFLNTVIDIDFELALSAIKYLEENTEEIVERLLNEIETATSKDFVWQSQIGDKISHSLPLAESHVNTLTQIINKGNMLGGAAAACMIELLGDNFKTEAFDLLVNSCDDYNFCTRIGLSIKRYVTEDDIPSLLVLCKKVQVKFDTGITKEYGGFDSALGYIMYGFSPSKVISAFYNKNLKPKEQLVQLDVLCHYLRDCNNNEGLQICIELLSSGIDKVVVEIYFILSFSKEDDNIDYSIFKPKHIKSLITIVKKNKSEISDWALSSLYNIFLKRGDLKKYAVENIIKSSGVLKAALFYSISTSKEHTSVYQALEDLLKLDSKDLQKENFELLSHMDKLNWIGQEKLFVQLLKLKNLKLAYYLCDCLVIYNDNESNLIFDIGPINWWLEWFDEYIKSKRDEWMFTNRVPMVITSYISKDKRQEFISEFNNPKSKYRKILSQIILRRMNDLKLEDFTEETLSYLLGELKSKKMDHYFTGSILADIATEKFVTERMLTLLKSTTGVEHNNLKTIIEKIGKNHKRRYLL
ncbi:MAG: SIR2 family protein [Bacteroidota bacterium]